MTKAISSKIAIGLSLAIISVSLFVPVLAGAQNQVPQQVTPPPNTNIDDVNDLVQLLGRIVNVLFTLLMVVAIIFIFYAAFLYLTAKGETENISKANKQLIYSAVAIAVALLAVAVRSIVERLITGQ